MGRLKLFCFLASCLSVGSWAATASQFDGTWNSNCYSQSANGQTEYGIDKMTISETAMDIVSAVYSDAACSSQAIATIHTGEALALNGDPGAPAGAEDADVNLSTLTLTFHNSMYISYMNSQQFCGESNWAVDQPQDVIGKNCGGQAMPAAGTKSYDLIGLGSDGNLYMGLVTTTLNGTSPETRPTALDTSIVYSKVASLISSLLD